MLDCGRVPSRRGAAETVRVPCLGGLTVHHLLTLRLAAGDAPVILLDRGWCASCPAGGRDRPAEASLATVRRLLAAIALPEALVPRWQDRPLPPTLRDDTGARSGISRRALFRRLSSPREGQLRPPEQSAGQAETSPVVRSHLRQIELLRRLSQIHGGTTIDHLLPAISVSDACRNSGACAAHCPTQALRLWQGETAEGLSFDPRSCLSCGLCARACPEQALTLDAAPDHPPPAQRRLVGARRIALCRHCGSETPDIDPEGHCPRCRRGVGMLRTLFGHPVISAKRESQPRGVP